MSDEQILSYGTVNIRRSDMQLLKCGQWLNDRILSFAAEYLYEQNSNVPTFTFAPPETEIVKMGDEGFVSDCFSMLDLKDKKFIFFMLSDNSNPDLVNGGSHWTLLVYNRESDEYLHLNSVPTSSQNLIWAGRIAKKTKVLIGAGNDEVKELKVPKQTNSSDCGLFVIEFMKNIIENNSLESLDLMKSEEISSRRRYWEELIMTMAAEQNQA